MSLSPPILGSHVPVECHGVSRAGQPGSHFAGALSPWRSMNTQCDLQVGRGSSVDPGAWDGERSSYLGSVKQVHI